MKKKYDIFDLVKLICSFMVVAIHSDFFHNVLYPWLDLAIPTFFIISSFLLFEKIKNTKEPKTVIHNYIMRLFKYYLFWFVLLLPYTIIKRKSWFESGVFLGIIKTTINLLFSSSFPASWYIVASIEGAILIYYLSNINNKVLLFLFYVAYIFICLFEPVSISKIIDLQHTFLKSTIFILIGKMYADGEFKVFEKKTSYYYLLLSSIILYILYRANIVNETKAYYLLIIPIVSTFLFGVIRIIDIKIDSSKIIRQFTSFLYPIHIFLCGFIRAIVTNKIKNVPIRNTALFLLVILISLVLFKIVKFLEKKEKLKFLEYSY